MPMARDPVARKVSDKAAKAAQADVIDLSRVDPPVWHIHSGGGTYGPFSIGQLQQFVIEGRLTTASQISYGDAQPVRSIRDTPRLSEALGSAFSERLRRRAEAANFLIVARAPSPAEMALWTRMSDCLGSLGKHVQAMPGTWLLRSGLPIKAVREALAASLPQTVQVIVLETREARLGWIGFSEDMTEAVRPVWNASLS